MRKLRLNVDGLAVESFDVSPAGVSAAGTIHARQEIGDDNKLPETNDFGRLGTCLPGFCTCDGDTTCDYSGCIRCPASDPVAGGGAGANGVYVGG